MGAVFKIGLTSQVRKKKTLSHPMSTEQVSYISDPYISIKISVKVYKDSRAGYTCLLNFTVVKCLKRCFKQVNTNTLKKLI